MSRPRTMPEKKRNLDEQVMTSMRITERMRRQLKAAAKHNRRSFNSEVNFRLAATLPAAE